MNMKNITGFISIVLTAACLCLATESSARCKEEWKEKIRSEKIAFLTVEIGLTPEEAQVFWPVYNQVDQEKDDTMKEIMRTFKELREASEAGKTEKEISGLLDKYLEAQEKLRAIEEGAADRYKAVLPVEKVVKLYLGEERFRRHHIRSMKGGPQGNGKPGPGR